MAIFHDIFSLESIIKKEHIGLYLHFLHFKLYTKVSKILSSSSRIILFSLVAKITRRYCRPPSTKYFSWKIPGKMLAKRTVMDDETMRIRPEKDYEEGQRMTFHHVVFGLQD